LSVAALKLNKLQVLVYTLCKKNNNNKGKKTRTILITIKLINVAFKRLPLPKQRKLLLFSLAKMEKYVLFISSFNSVKDY